MLLERELSRSKRTVSPDILQASERSGSRRSSSAASSLQQLPFFRLSEITMGRRLGDGGFCSVYAIRRVRLQDGDVAGAPVAAKNEEENRDDSLSRSQRRSKRPVHTRESLERACRGVRPDSTNARYVLKYVRPTGTKLATEYEAAVKDSVTELRMLNSLRHPNIVRVVGVVPNTNDAAGNRLVNEDAGSAAGGRGGYHLVLDLLDGTLEKTMDQWRSRASSLLFAYSKKKRTELLRDKIAFLQQIADALRFLHERKIMYRDLKPENVGVDRRGVVKIFDFGQAKRLAGRKADENGAYELSIAGTLQYMAPEVIRRDRYGLSSDAYSFGVLLWECLYLKRAFKDWNWYRLSEQAKNPNKCGIGSLHKGSSSKSTPPALTELVTDACSFDSRDRPSFEDVCETLRKEWDSVQE